MGESEKAQQKTYASAYMMKTAYTILYVMAFFIGFFLAQVYSVFADLGDEYTIYTDAGGSTNKQFGHNAQRLGVCDTVTFDRDTYVSTTTIKVYKYGSPTDNLKGYIWVPTGNPAVATSTSENTVAGSSLSSSVFDPATDFYFDNFFVASGTTACIGVMRDGSYNASNYYLSRGAGTGHSTCYVYTISRTCAESIGSSIAQTITGYEYEEPPEEEPPTSGGSISTTTIEWIIASTTEAVYNVAYALNMFLGVFMFILFFYVGYRYIRIFL